MHNLAIDLETLDTCPNAVILSIGAAYFDPETNSTGPTFYVNVNPGSQLTRSISKSTQAWWLTQPAEARDALLVDQVSIEVALSRFTQWIEANDFDGCTTPWGNGASFDIAILNDAYHEVGRPSPWKFWNEQCLRTLKTQVPLTEPLQFVGVPHNALDDAVHQAKLASALLRKLKGALA